MLLNTELVLDPRKKFGHFTKHWGDQLQADVKEVVQKKVCTLVTAACQLNINVQVFQVY